MSFTALNKILVASCLLFTTVVGASNVYVSASTPSLNQTMTQIGETMVDIFPLIYAKRELSKDEHTKFGYDLTRMVTLFRAIEMPIKKKSGTYQVSYQFAMKHLSKTKHAYDKGDIEQARSQLYALGPICTSCHMQDTRLRTLFNGSQRSRFDDDFSFAEFNYVTRNYSEAIKYYDKYLSSNTTKTEWDIVQPLQRLITIYTQIYGRPGQGAKQLKKYSTLKEHTPETKKHLQRWIAGLKQLEHKEVGKYQDVDFKTLQNFVTQYLGVLDELSAIPESSPEDVVARVWLRGLLYHYLSGSPSQDEIPKLLYWLSICDRSIDFNFYFSLADLYLKDCILNHPEHPYAKRCFDEYNAYVMFSYTGADGTYIPAEIQRELDQLQNAIK